MSRAGSNPPWAQVSLNESLNLPLDGFKCRAIEFDAASTVLISRRQTGVTRRLAHMHDERIFRRARAAILADADGQVVSGIQRSSRRLLDRIRSQFLKCGRVPQQHVAVQKRNLLRRGERFFLRTRQLFAEIRNHHIPASQHAVTSLHRVHLAPTSVSDLYFRCLRRIARMFHADCRAVQTNPHRRRGVRLSVVCFQG